MDPRRLILWMAVVLYVLWLLAGLVDYLCHRRTRIEATSGRRESWLHLAQFLALGVALLAASLLAVTPAALAVIATCVAAHSVLAFVDVSYTQGRRHISPLEQHVHGYLEVLPIVAVALWVVLAFDELGTAPWALQWDSPLSRLPRIALLGSFLVLAGTPIVEEWLRTRRRPAGGTNLASRSTPSKE